MYTFINYIIYLYIKYIYLKYNDVYVMYADRNNEIITYGLII